jgi:hypothetical protein
VMGGRYGSKGLVPCQRIHGLPVGGHGLWCFLCRRGSWRQCSFCLLGVATRGCDRCRGSALPGVELPVGPRHRTVSFGQLILIPSDCRCVAAQGEYAFEAFFCCSGLKPDPYHHSEELPEVIEPGITVKGAGFWDCETPGWPL